MNLKKTPQNLNNKLQMMKKKWISVAGQYTTGVPTVGGYTANQVPPAPFSCMDVDSETDSNHDTALTLACAGGHEDLVELLLSRGADIGNFYFSSPSLSI